MTHEEAKGRILEIITPFVKETEALGNACDTTSILDDLKVNSARLVDIILAFEDRFDIEVDDDDADKVKTVGDAVEMVLAKAT